MKALTWRASVLLAVCLTILAVGCATASPTPAADALKQQAAAEATLILQRAEATAIVLHAQQTAAAMVQVASPTRAAPAVQPTIMAAPPTPAAANAAAALDATSTPVAQTSEPRLLGVTFAADSGMVIVYYAASPALARTWQPGNVSVTDEATGFKYNEVPVMPVIGPLIAHPVQEGQQGYVMFVNPPGNLLKSGARVTVILGEFKQEHVVVQ